MPNRDFILTRDEFRAQKNNFHLHFVEEEMFVEAYRAQAAFVECMEQDPSFADLVAELEALQGSTSPEFESKL